MIIIGRKTAVNIPLSPIARAEKAAAFSLISIALAVPIPWENNQRAKPFEVSCFIFINLNTIVPNNAPIIPVINTNPTASDGIAPICSEVIIAIGAVIDFVVIDKIVGSSAPKIHNKDTAITIEKTPAIKRVRTIGKKSDFIYFKFLYNGNAKATVAGPKKKCIISTLLKYSSKDVFVYIIKLKSITYAIIIGCNKVCLLNFS